MSNKKGMFLAGMGLVLGMQYAHAVEVPNVFQPNTPAKASEVNENFRALADALSKVKQISLYQNGKKIGDSILLNVVRLDTGYLTVPVKRSGNSAIFMQELGGGNGVLHNV